MTGPSWVDSKFLSQTAVGQLELIVWLKLVDFFVGSFFGGCKGVWVLIGSLLGNLAGNEQSLIKVDNLKSRDSPSKTCSQCRLSVEVAASDAAAVVSSVSAAAGRQVVAFSFTCVSEVAVISALNSKSQVLRLDRKCLVTPPLCENSFQSCPRRTRETLSFESRGKQLVPSQCSIQGDAQIMKHSK